MSGWRLMAVAVAIAAVALGLSPLVAAHVHAATLFGLYSVPSNSVIPLPHEPGLLYFIPRAAPLDLAVAGALGTLVAAYLDVVVVAWLFSRKTGEAVRRSRSWRVVTRVVMRAPFATVFVTAAVGIPPIQAVRLLVLATDYPLGRYALAAAAGRFLRFYGIASLGRALSPPTWIMTTLTVAFLVWPVMLLFRAQRKRLVDDEADLLEVQPVLVEEAAAAVAHVMGEDQEAATTEVKEPT